MTAYRPGTMTCYECGCAVDQDADGACSIAYCAMHTAAPQLLEALRQIGDLDATSATHAIAQVARASGIARAAIAAAEEE